MNLLKNSGPPFHDSTRFSPLSPPGAGDGGGDLEGFIGFRAHMRAVADDKHQLQV